MPPFDAYLDEIPASPVYDGSADLPALQPGSALYRAVLAAQDQAIADEATPAYSIFRTHPASLLAHLAERMGLPFDTDRLREGLDQLSYRPRSRKGQSVERLLEVRRQAVSAVWQMRVRQMIDADAADRVLISDYRVRGIGSARRRADADVQATVTLVARGFQRCLYWLSDNPDGAAQVAVDCLGRLAEAHDFQLRPHLYPALIVRVGRDLLSLHRRSAKVRRQAAGECECVALALESGAAVDSIDDEKHAHALADQLQEHDQPMAARERRESFEDLLSRVLQSDDEDFAGTHRRARTALQRSVEEMRVGGFMTPQLEALVREVDDKLRREQARARARHTTRATAMRPSATMSGAWREVVLPPDAMLAGWLQSYRAPTQAALPL